MHAYLIGPTHHPGEETQCFQVNKDVGGLGGDQEHVKSLQGLVDVAHTLCLHKRVLLARAHQLGECGEEALYAGPAHLHKLPG